MPTLLSETALDKKRLTAPGAGATPQGAGAPQPWFEADPDAVPYICKRMSDIIHKGFGLHRDDAVQLANSAGHS